MSSFMKAFQIILEAQITRIDRRIFFKKSIKSVIEAKTRAPNDPTKKAAFEKRQDEIIQKIEDSISLMEKNAPQISLEQLQDKAKDALQKTRAKRLQRQAASRAAWTKSVKEHNSPKKMMS